MAGVLAGGNISPIGSESVRFPARARWRAPAMLLLPLLLAAGLVAHARGRRAEPPAASSPLAVVRGRFLVSYGRAKSADLASWASRLKGDSVLERAAARLNALVSLPQDVLLSFRECGDDDAYYEDGRVTFCYEEVADYADLLAPGDADVPLTERETKQVEDATTFFLYHEAGHALVDVLSLPVTGKEEDAVDQFAVYLSSRGQEDAPATVLPAAEVLGRLARSEEQTPGDLALWDVHSLDGQREANVLCWLYGSNAKRYGRAVRRAGLPRERRGSCGDEYEQLAASWDALLAPYLKPPAITATAAQTAPRAPRPRAGWPQR